MIKLKTMKRNILIFILLITILSACVQKKSPKLERFEGETVATLQTPANELAENFPPDFPADTMALEEILLTTETPKLTELVITNPSGNEILLTVTPTKSISNPYPTQPIGPTQTNGSTPTIMPTLRNPIWTGTWNIWFQDDTGDYLIGVMVVNVDGNLVNGTAELGKIDYLFKGTLSTDKSKVDGDWYAGNREGTFWWQMIAEHIFVGSWDERFGFCGEGESLVRPSNCRRLP